MTMELLISCAQHMGSQLPAREQRALKTWWAGQRARSHGLFRRIMELRDLDAESAIDSHRAHRHRWYEQLANEVSIDEFAAFLLENGSFPAFLPLLQRLFFAQITDEGRAAIGRNIADERAPVPHAELMRRLMLAVKDKAGPDVELHSYPSLIDRTLVFYYGYYCDPWNLVGSLQATEAMGIHRLQKMGRGLERLGLSPHALEFITVHLACEAGHAREWHSQVVVPSIRTYPDLSIPIAEGIAACLETSARYLDDLSRRAENRRWPLGARP